MSLAPANLSTSAHFGNETDEDFDEDEVVALGRRLGVALRREEDLLSRLRAATRARKYSAASYLSTASEHETDRVYRLKDMITSVKATSLAGAAMQIVEALSRVEFVWDQFPEQDENRRIKEEVRAINRLLYSAFDVVDGLAGRKLADTVTPDFGSRHRNPWTPVEERCGELSEQVAPPASAGAGM